MSEHDDDYSLEDEAFEFDSDEDSTPQVKKNDDGSSSDGSSNSDDSDDDGKSSSSEEDTRAQEYPKWRPGGDEGCPDPKFEPSLRNGCVHRIFNITTKVLQARAPPTIAWRNVSTPSQRPSKKPFPPAPAPLAGARRAFRVRVLRFALPAHWFPTVLLRRETKGSKN